MRNRVWTTQPPAGTPIDWDSPLSEGLIFCASGPRFIDSVGSSVQTKPPGLVTPDGPLGMCLYSPSAGHQAEWNPAYVIKALTGSSQYSALTYADGPSSSWDGRGTNSDILRLNGFLTNFQGLNGNNFWAAWWNSGGTGPFEAHCPFTPSGRTVLSVAADLSADVFEWSQNGSYPVSSSSGAKGVLGASTTSPLVCGGSTTTEFFNGYIGLVALWKRKLAPQESQRLGHNPWQIFHKRRRFYSIASGGTAGNLTGSSAVTFGQAGTLTGSGALAGTSALTFSGTSTLSGLGALLGSSAISFTASGSLVAPGLMVGSASVSFGGAGELHATGTLTGSSAVTSAASATLRGAGALAAVGAITSGASGTLAGHGALSGSSGATFSGTATLAATGALHGTTAIVFTATLTPPVGFLTGVPRYTIRRPLARNFTLARANGRVFTAARAFIRTFTVTSMSIQFPIKGTAEKVPLTFDFTNDLPSGVTLSGTPTVTVALAAGTDSRPSSILNGAAGFNSASTQVIQPVQGGINGCDYLLTATCATTQSNLTLTLIGQLPVRRDPS